MMPKGNPLSYFWCFCWGIALILAVGTTSLKAQPVLGASNIALGGGGTAYLTGIEATLWNPANLALFEQSANFHIALGHTGILYEPVLSSKEANNQYFRFTDTYHVYNAEQTIITREQRNSILANNYPSNALTSQHQSRADIILGGALWQHKDEALSIIARARFGSRIEMGRGWYSNQFIENGNSRIRDFNLVHQRNHLYEIAFGYGRSFTFINGLLPNLNKLYIGISPKIVLAGPSLNLRYNSHIRESQENNKNIIIDEFSYQSTGSYSDATIAYQNGVTPRQAIQKNFSNKVVPPITGYGMGFDFGLTYVIPLGSDLSTVYFSPPEAISKKVIRVSLSINDIGMVRYNDNPLLLDAGRDSTAVTISPSVTDEMFIGSKGQHLSFFNGNANILNPLAAVSNSSSRESYISLLPTSINAGMMVQYSRIKLNGDLTLGMHETAFTDTKLSLHLGMETRPIDPLPLRFGMRLASGLPTQLGVGTGFETNRWKFNIGTQFLIRSQTFTSEISGGAFAGLQLHF